MIQPPPLPTRVPADQAMATARGLWHAAECSDYTVVQRVLDGLRKWNHGDDTAYRFRTQHEVDGVIARYRAHATRQR